ncbi:(deoxy)nucleoside triphosphate pyrophosphohydrolase [Marinicella meishanensis]|uniref:(deoxy)nucleoside triphosphate pyrophosphohydrolase n=1 Tax=Marinicella meishanensis TaxID=2873263 RepID=UPI001CC007A6|nr:(deoxy)nucleoside triphosphate pyrophosphohydrolase [Marinicella sp. NBU2979]
MPRSPELTANTTHVVVLVLQNGQGEVLLTQRQSHQHLPGLWEYPGGKVETGESRQQALQRECLEELGYRPINPSPILEIPHQYPNKRVCLHVFHEHNPQASVHSAEQQNMRWVPIIELPSVPLPPANATITEYLLNRTNNT